MGWEGLSEEQKKRGEELGGGCWEWARQEVLGTIIRPWGPLLPGHPRACAGEGWQQRGRDGSTASELRLGGPFFARSRTPRPVLSHVTSRCAPGSQSRYCWLPDSGCSTQSGQLSEQEWLQYQLKRSGKSS